MLPVLLLVLPAYLVGTFPTAVMIGRAGGHDVYREGSGNPGASNVYRLMGFGPALLVFVGDVLKGVLPAVAGLLLWGHAGAYALGIAAVVGHVFPVWTRFKGGRGVATAAGMVLVLYPLVTLALFVVWVAIAKGLHRASLASLTVVVVFPAAVWVSGGEAAEVAALAAISVFVVARHSANLRRLLRGEELALRSDPASSPPGDHEAA